MARGASCALRTFARLVHLRRMDLHIHLPVWLLGRAACFVYGVFVGVVPGFGLFAYIAQGISAPRW